MNLDQAIEQACGDVGICPPKKREFGRWLNTDTLAGKKGKGDGRVIVQEHFVTAWNWQTGLKSTVSMRDGMSAKEQRAIAQSVAKSKVKAQKDAEQAAAQAESLAAAAGLSTHPYLVGKGFRDEQAMVLTSSDIRRLAGHVNDRGDFIPADYLIAGERAIVVPARRAGKITSVQIIWEDGTKKFLFGGEIGGTSHRLASGVYTWLCEGYATALTVRAALKGLNIRATVLCCFSAANVAAVALHARGRSFVAADNDKPLAVFNGLGTGEHYARQTCLPYGMPPQVRTDFNDMHQTDGIFAVQRVLTSVMSGRRTA